MSASPERALLAALRATALADAGVKAVFGDPARLYDDRPADPSYPFATIGRIESRSLGASLSPAHEHALNLHVWSRHGGRAEALEGIAALRAALDDTALTLDGHRLVLVFAAYADVFRAGDGRTSHGVLRLKAITEPV